MTSIQGPKAPPPLPAGTGSTVTAAVTEAPAPGWSRCPITLADARLDARKKRARCIHPKGHGGVHVFGAVQ